MTAKRIRMADTIKIQELLSVTIYLAEKAGNIISDVYNNKDFRIHDKGKSTNILKPEDPCTTADRRSQRLICSSLRKQWPNLKIIGEEDSTVYFTDNDAIDAPRSNLTNYTFPNNIQSLNIDDICIWVDPLDGTQDFVHHTPAICTVLIGIALKEQPLAGVLHYPLPAQTNKSHTVWGVVGGPYSGVTLPAEFPKNRFAVVTSCHHHTDSFSKYTEKMKEKPTSVAQIGGAGHKILMVITGEADSYIYPQKGTKKWDTCAPHAILLSVHPNAYCTTTTGKTLEYHYSVEHMNSSLLITRDKFFYDKSFVKYND